MHKPTKKFRHVDSTGVIKSLPHNRLTVPSEGEVNNVFWYISNHRIAMSDQYFTLANTGSEQQILLLNCPEFE